MGDDTRIYKDKPSEADAEKMLTTAEVFEGQAKDLVFRIKVLKDERERLDGLIEEHTRKLMSLIEANPDLDTSITYKDEEYRGNVIRSSRLVANEAVLAMRWPQLWERVSKRVLDKSRLSDALAVGDVPAEVQEWIRRVPNKPHVRIDKRRPEVPVVDAWEGGTSG